MKRKVCTWVGCGVFCILFLLAASWYAIVWNGSRLVAPMGFERYSFQIQDLPLILAVSLFCIYAVASLIALLYAIYQKQQQIERTNTTRMVDPRLGYLGFLGLFGFLGFWTYAQDGTIFPFVFFIFFGFFGFAYEGRLSGTFMDERFRENEAKAHLKASNIALMVIFIAFLFLAQGKLFGSLEYTLIAVLLTLSAAFALRIFLGVYLLYRYDHDEQAEESEE